MKPVIILMVVLVSVGAQHQPASCRIDVSVDERRNLMGTSILNKLGLEEAPVQDEPLLSTPEQDSNLKAIQELRAIYEKEDKPECTKRNAFSTQQQASFQIEAKTPLVQKYSLYDYTVYNYYDHLIGKRRSKQPAKSPSIPLPTTLYQFKFPINVTSNNGKRYVSSKLYLLRKVTSLSGRRTFLTNTETIRLDYVYKVMQYSKKSNRLYSVRRQEIIDTKVVDAVDGYMTFDTTAAVNKWIEHNNKKSGIITFKVIIQPPVLLSTGLRLSPVVEFNISNNFTAQHVLNFARLDAIPDSSRMTRRKRQGMMNTVSRLDAEYCLSKPGEPNCCVRSLTIDFAKDLGYDWIISPKTFQPNYCTGLCPAMWPTASNSTSFLRLYKERNPTSAVEPCCSPEEIGPLTVLLDVGNGPTFTDIPDVIIKSCICR